MTTGLQQLVDQLHRRLDAQEQRITAGTVPQAAQVVDVSEYAGTVDVVLANERTLVTGVPVVGGTAAAAPEVGQNMLLLGGITPIALPAAGQVSGAAPPIVSNLTADPGIGSVTVSWDPLDVSAIRDNKGYYRVQIDVVPAFNSILFNEHDTANTQVVFTGLTTGPSGTTYYVRVQGVTYTGQEGTWSPTVAVTVIAAITGNELTALNLAVGRFIQSTSYVPGVSGWAINADGSAEFNNVIVRGALRASQVTTVEGANIVPNGEFETNVLNWTVNANGTIARDTSTFTPFGSASMKVTFTVGSPVPIVTSDAFPVQPNQAYNAVAYVRSNAGTGLQRRLLFTVTWYDASMASLAGGLSINVYEIQGQWVAVGGSTIIAPSNAAFAAIQLSWLDVGAVSETHNIDHVEFVPASRLIGAMQTASFGSRVLIGAPAGQPVVVLYQNDYDAGGLWADLTQSPSNNTDMPRVMLLADNMSPTTPPAATSWISVIGNATTTSDKGSILLATSGGISLNGALGTHISGTPVTIYNGSYGAVSVLVDNKPIYAQLAEARVQAGTNTTSYTRNANATTIADVDAANLIVTFTAPASGIVLIEYAIGQVHASVGGNVYFGVRDNSNVDVANSHVTTGDYGTQWTNVFAAFYQRKRVSGLTPGTSYTWKLTWFCQGATQNLTAYSGPDYGEIAMRIIGVFS
jgi:hypothetical protein